MQPKTKTTTSSSGQQNPIFNEKYAVLSSLGVGKTSRVYLCQDLKDPKKQFAMKLLREEYLKKERNMKTAEQEIKLLKSLDNKGIVKLIDSGSNGTVRKPSGTVVKDLVYLVLEYVPTGTMFSLCESNGAMGENTGRFFMRQMIDTLKYLHGKQIVHRDVKLENLLLDENLGIKFADFGFARYQKDHLLKSQRGTLTYMAPEIKLGLQYDGRQADIFSVGVILFIIVVGIFPFQEAKKDEYFYNLINKGYHEKYWMKVGGQDLSKEFKSLIMKMFSFQGSERPTLDQIANHPWMKDNSFNYDKTRDSLINKLKEANEQHSTDSASEEVN